MSIRHYGSDFDDLDEGTTGLLASRYCKVAMLGGRDAEPRIRRGHDGRNEGRGRKPRRPRERHANLYAE